VELTFHDMDGNLLMDRSGQPFHLLVSLKHHQAASLDLNANTLPLTGGRMEVVPCIKVLRGSASVSVGACIEWINLDTKETMVFAKF